MPRTTTDDVNHDHDPSRTPRNGTPQVPAAPAKKVHAPRLDQHGEAGADSPTDPADNARRGKNPEATTSDEGA